MTETMDKELVTIPAQSALQVFTIKGMIDPYLQKIRAEIDAFVPNVTTAKGRKEIASIAFKVSQSKSALEAVGKKLADEQKDIPKKIDACRREIKETLDKWRDEVRQPLTEWEEAEEQRVAYHKSMVQHIVDVGNGFIGGQPQPFGVLFRELEQKIVIDQSWQEFEAEGHRAKADAMSKLKAASVEHARREAEKAELERLRKEADERAQRDRDEAIKKEAADAARRDAEAKAKAEADQAEAGARAERAAFERRELELKLAAEAAERRAVEAEARARQEADNKARAEAAEVARREADVRHRQAVNKAALEAFVHGGIDEVTAKSVVSLIAAKAIPSVSISY